MAFSDQVEVVVDQLCKDTRLLVDACVVGDVSTRSYEDLQRGQALLAIDDLASLNLALGSAYNPGFSGANRRVVSKSNPRVRSRDR